MANEYGKDWRVELGDGAGTEAFSTLGGEGSWDKKVSSDKVDLSSKDDGRIKASGWGQQEITISVQGKVKLPDTGLERAYAVSNQAVPECNMRLRKSGTTTKFAARVGIGNFSMSGPSDGAVTYSFDMTCVALPTVDALAAV